MKEKPTAALKVAIKLPGLFPEYITLEDAAVLHAQLGEALAKTQKNLPGPEPASLIPIDSDVDELRKLLDRLCITSGNIGAIRRALFLPWSSTWNAIVRDETASREISDEMSCPCSSCRERRITNQLDIINARKESI